MTNVAILVAGAGGRMGRAVIAEALRTPGVELAGGFEHAGAAEIGKDLGVLAGLDATGLEVAASAEEALGRASVVIDFTTPKATVETANAAAEKGVALIVGTTGFDAADEAAIAAAAKKTAIVKSGNMSLGVNLLSALVEEASRRLSEDFDIEIFEAHHRAKVDAPSGTALMLAQAAARGRGVSLAEKTAGIGSDRAGARKPGDIGFSVMRGGGIVGEHTVSFAGPGEVITLGHRAIDRGLFAKGAVAAARWVCGREPGLYSMRDVLGV